MVKKIPAKEVDQVHLSCPQQTRELNRRLFDSIRFGDANLAEYFLDAGANIEAKREFATPLIWSINRRQFECFELLIDRGADLYARDRLGATPILLAIENKLPAFVECLLRADPAICGVSQSPGSGPKADGHPLASAALKGSFECLRILLSYSIDLDASDSFHGPALVAAARSGSVDCVRELLNAGFDIEKRDDLGRTPLFAAAEDPEQPFWPAEFRHADVVELLIARGARIDVMDGKGRYVMDVARPECRAVIERVRLKAMTESVMVVDEVGHQSGMWL